jgi:hypothetical protein
LISLGLGEKKQTNNREIDRNGGKIRENNLLIVMYSMSYSYMSIYVLRVENKFLNNKKVT